MTWHQAEYLRGNMTDTLIFRYTVVEGDHTNAFDVLDTRTAKRQRFSTALVRPPATKVTETNDYTAVWIGIHEIFVANIRNRGENDV